MRRFINATSTNVIVFTRGTTESINLVVSGFGEAFMQEGDEVILSVMEHHSNIVPWQLLQERKGIKIKVVPMNDKGELLLDEYEKLFTERTKIVSIMHVSNVLGTINPIKEMVATAHKYGVPFMVDAAQSIPHMKVDVQDLDADFLVFSGHKVYAPTAFIPASILFRRLTFSLSKNLKTHLQSSVLEFALYCKVSGCLNILS